MKKLVLSAIVLLVAAGVQASIFETNDTQHANLKVAAGWGMPSVASDDVMWRRGLVADKASGTVTVLAVPGSGFGCKGFMRLSFSVEDDVIARSAEGFKRAVASYRE